MCLKKRSVSSLSADRSMAVVLTLTHLFVLATSKPSPEDWASGSAIHTITDDNSFISAYINVSREDENGWRWDKTDLGRYGGGFIGPAYGLLVHVTSDTDPNDHTGCKLPFRSTRLDGQLPQPEQPWIALIKRGKCNFEEKVENAYRSNAAGVLVYNDRDSASLDKMRISSDNGSKYFSTFSLRFSYNY